MHVTIDMKGMGISFVDNEPKELMYISFYKLKIDYLVETENKDQSEVTDTTIDFKLDHM